VIPAGSSSLLQWFARFGHGRLWATATLAAMVLVAGIYQIRREGPTAPRPATQAALPFAETATTLDEEEQSLGPIEPASTLGPRISHTDLALRENLATVNAFIRECSKRLEQDPADPMAREYLSTAYQQKAEILAAMMERGRSVN
jgi:hypothetical protein